VSSWHPYCYLADWLTQDMNCHPAPLNGTHAKGLTVRDCKGVTSVACKVVKMTQLVVSNIYLFYGKSGMNRYVCKTVTSWPILKLMNGKRTVMRLERLDTI